MCPAGYGISSARDLVEAGFDGTTMTFAASDHLLVHELWGRGDKTARRRTHVSSIESIHRNFQAKVGEKAQDLLAFARRYGLLMQDTFMLRERKRFGLEIWAEPLQTWLDEAELVRVIVEVLQILRSTAELSREQHSRLMEQLATLADRQFLEKGPFVLRSKGGPRSALEHRLQAIIQSKLDMLGGVRLDVETGTVGFRPRTVLGSIYVGLFDEWYRGRSVHRKCKWCGWFFPLTHRSKQLCSKACENALYRYRQRLDDHEDLDDTWTPKGIDTS